MESALSVARHILQFGAGLLVYKGIIDASMVETVIGIGVGIVTLSWYFWQKRSA